MNILEGRFSEGKILEGRMSFYCSIDEIGRQKFYNKKTN
jgi:hypothetical protein